MDLDKLEVTCDEVLPGPTGRDTSPPKKKRDVDGSHVWIEFLEAWYQRKFGSQSFRHGEMKSREEKSSMK